MPVWILAPTLTLWLLNPTRLLAQNTGHCGAALRTRGCMGPCLPSSSVRASHSPHPPTALSEFELMSGCTESHRMVLTQPPTAPRVHFCHRAHNTTFQPHCVSVPRWPWHLSSDGAATTSHRWNSPHWVPTAQLYSRALPGLFGLTLCGHSCCPEIHRSRGVSTVPSQRPLLAGRAPGSLSPCNPYQQPEQQGSRGSSPCFIFGETDV